MKDEDSFLDLRAQNLILMMALFASSFILVICWISSDLHVVVMLANFNAFQSNRIGDFFDTTTINCRWRILPTDNQWRDKERNLVDQSGFQEQTGQRWTTFNQHALNRPFRQFIGDPG